MIRLRWPEESIDAMTAATFRHPRLARLRGTGGWSFRDRGGRLVATMDIPGWSAAGWGAWEPGTDGAEFSLADNPPTIESLDPARIPTDAERIDLACGERLWVLPARLSPRRLSFGGGDRGPATAYGVAAHDLNARMELGPVSPDDVMRVVFMASSSVNRRLIPEVLVGYGIVSTADITPLLEAAWRIPKAPPGGATSSSSPPASSASP